MAIPKTPPPWNHEDKEGSLEAYAAWLNQVARGAFLEEGHHPEMFLFVTEKGGIEGCQFPAGISQEQRDDIVTREVSRLKPFGTIQILIKTIYDLKLFSIPKFQKLRFIGATDSEPNITSRECLLVVMMSRTGKEKYWANPIVKEGHRLTLMDTVETYPAEDERLEGNSSRVQQNNDAPLVKGSARKGRKRKGDGNE